MAKELSWPYYLPIGREGIDGFIPFSRALILWEKQTVDWTYHVNGPNIRMDASICSIRANCMVYNHRDSILLLDDYGK